MLPSTHNQAIKNGPQKDVGRTAFHAASYGKRYAMMKKLIISISALVLHIALTSCSNQNRSHLYVTICPDSYKVDNQAGNDLSALLDSANSGWASIQVFHPQFIDPDRLEATRKQLHRFSTGSAVYFTKKEQAKCSIK